MTEENREKKLNAILRAAYKTFSEGNYSMLTMDQLAKACSVTRATLYQYFGNKRELFFRSVNYSLKIVYDELVKIHYSGHLTYREELENIIDTVIDELILNKNLLPSVIGYITARENGYEICVYYVRLCRAKLRHMFSVILIEASKKGEFQGGFVKHFNTTILGYLNDVSINLAAKAKNPNIKVIKADISHLLDQVIGKDNVFSLGAEK